MSATPVEPATARLRQVLAANAATSVLGGVVGLVGAGFLSDRLGFDHVLGTVAVSAGLVAFGIDVFLTSRTDERARRFAPWVSLADAVWVIATVVVIASGSLTTAGNLVMGLIGLAVADFAVLQLAIWRRIRTAAPGRSRVVAEAA